MAVTPSIKVPERAWFDAIYARINRHELIHPDPLEFVYRYENNDDREVAGFIAACLAYGNVNYILRSVDHVLEQLGEHPSSFLREAGDSELRDLSHGFQHRWTTGAELYRLLKGMREVGRSEGSLRQAFARYHEVEHDDTLPALEAWVAALKQGEREVNSLLPDPARGSACKRYHMYLRWMIRSDDVDPGTWDGFAASKLIVPLDVHMHSSCYRLGLTSRKQANLKSAREVTAAFRCIVPEDPCKYDFSITRLGIRDDMSTAEIFKNSHE